MAKAETKNEEVVEFAEQKLASCLFRNLKMDFVKAQKAASIIGGFFREPFEVENELVGARVTFFLHGENSSTAIVFTKESLFFRQSDSGGYVEIKLNSPIENIAQSGLFGPILLFTTKDGSTARMVKTDGKIKAERLG